MDGDYIIDVPEEGKNTTRHNSSDEDTPQTTLQQSSASFLSERGSVANLLGSYDAIDYESSADKSARQRAEHGGMSMDPVQLFNCYYNT
jgi:hypothetical protein